MEKKQGAQSRAAEYGHALLSNCGGWTLREMLGSDYDNSSSTGDNRFAQRDFQQSSKQVSLKTDSSLNGAEKK
jgi:hypothetical protein